MVDVREFARFTIPLWVPYAESLTFAYLFVRAVGADQTGNAKVNKLLFILVARVNIRLAKTA